MFNDLVKKKEYEQMLDYLCIFTWHNITVEEENLSFSFSNFFLSKTRSFLGAWLN